MYNMNELYSYCLEILANREKLHIVIPHENHWEQPVRYVRQQSSETIECLAAGEGEIWYSY